MLAIASTSCFASPRMPAGCEHTPCRWACQRRRRRRKPSKGTDWHALTHAPWRARRSGNHLVEIAKLLGNGG
eukprot:15483741-Alexandrium_andersonii.AAC.1